MEFKKRKKVMYGLTFAVLRSDLYIHVDNSG